MSDKQPPAAQPVAWLVEWIEGDRYMGAMLTDVEPCKASDEKVTPLYATPDPRIAEYRELLRDALGVFAGDFEINPRDVRDRIAAALKEG